MDILFWCYSAVRLCAFYSLFWGELKGGPGVSPPEEIFEKVNAFGLILGILHVISKLVKKMLIKKNLSVTLRLARAGWNGPAGRIWPAGRQLSSPDLGYSRR